jgi:hypothetical protein
MSLIGGSVSEVVLVMHGAAVTQVALLVSGAGFAAGLALVHVAHCIE